MSETMVERVAKLIATSLRLPPDSDRCRTLARAVIMKMRNPTMQMCVMGEPSRFAPGDSEAIWQAMIDTALS